MTLFYQVIKVKNLKKNRFTTYFKKDSTIYYFDQ